MGDEPRPPADPDVIRELRALRGAVAGLCIVLILCTASLIVALYNRELALVLILLMGLLLALVCGVRFTPLTTAAGKGVGWVRRRGWERKKKPENEEEPVPAESLEEKADVRTPPDLKVPDGGNGPDPENPDSKEPPRPS